MSHNRLRRVAPLLAALIAPGALAHEAPPRGSNLSGTDLRPLPLLGSSDRVSSGSAFNPDISVIIDTVYFSKSGDADEPAGFDAGHHHGHGHDHGHGLEEGFNLREAEIVFSASVDNYFDAALNVAVTEHDIEVEEAWIATRSLPSGLRLKAGKFLSDIGYINAQHPHDWAFVDRPLVNEFLFGDHGLQEKGVQLTWLPPLPVYTLFGVELLQGESEGIAPYVGAGRVSHVTVVPDDQGNPRRIRWRDDNPFKDRQGPRLVTGFAKFGPDLGDDHALQFGISGGRANSFQRDDLHSSLRYETWDGSAWFAGADAVYKYDAGRPFGQGSLTLQGEYFYREIDADFREFRFHDGDLTLTNALSRTAKQDGLYVQALYGIAPRWQVGLRAEGVGLRNDNALVEDDFFRSFDPSYRYSTNLTFRPTEFSMLRAQVNHLDYATADNHRDRGWEFMLQLQVALGVHGAHKF